MGDAGAALAPDLRKRIEIMADHIARNGPDFEATVKQKNASNPQFAFLYGGEGNNYYQQCLNRHHGQQGAKTSSLPQALPPPPPPLMHAAPAAVASASLSNLLHGSTAQSSPSRAATAPAGGGDSLANLLRGGQAHNAPPGELAESLRRWKEPAMLALTPDVERQLQGVMSSLAQMASRDAIKSGRLWIECNSALAQHIAGHLVRSLPLLQSCAHRLHVLYLVHDVLQTEAARSQAHAPLIRAFKPYLPWMLRPSYQLARKAGGPDDTSRVLRLLQLWVDRGIMTSEEAEDARAIVQADELPGAQSLQTGSVRQASESTVPSQGACPGMAVSGGMPAPAPVPRLPGLPYAQGSPHGAASSLGHRAGVPRPPLPALGGYQRLALHSGRSGMQQTPETVPVGVMASMLAEAVKQVQREKTGRYKPLDPACTPQMLPPMQLPTQRLLGRVEDFYEELKDHDRGSSSSRSRSRSRSRSSSSSRSRSRSGRRRDDTSGFSASLPSMNAVPPPVC
eukprot:TRINITY_DN10785_c0_g1_i1.p1 TRINITY_DN10785_c0_g1~~TRINITY_DN10785_c0_g1_i1.p1  ORF type:complete len:533 (+),score=85.57 TRINITY_DN10785_c0_g1_i1:75-1601(+)